MNWVHKLNITFESYLFIILYIVTRHSKHAYHSKHHHFHFYLKNNEENKNTNINKGTVIICQTLKDV
jgi:protease II